MRRSRTLLHRSVLWLSGVLLVVYVISLVICDSPPVGKVGLNSKSSDGVEEEEEAESKISSSRSRDQRVEAEDDGSATAARRRRLSQMSAFERMWEDDGVSFEFLADSSAEDDKETEGEEKQRWSKEDRRDTTEDMSEADKVVNAIRMKLNSLNTPDVIQVVDPPNLADQKPGMTLKKFRLVLNNDQSMSPVEPITNLLNKRKEPEIPLDDEEGNGGSSESTADENSAQFMYEQAIELLGVSASRDSTGHHVITSVGKTEKVEQAYALLQQAALRGHKKAMEIVAWGQLLGPLPLDIEGARQKFEILAKKGYPNAQMALGFMHANALETTLNSALPILYYTFSSIAGGSWSQMALGYRYWGGIGVQVSCEKALEQYRRVAATVASEVSEVGSSPAIQRIRLLDEIEGTSSTSTSSAGSTGNILNSDILDYYTMLAERGDLQALVGLGQLHFQGGRGISPDHHLALRYFRRAADAGSPVAMAFLGKMYLEGNDAVEADTANALKWFQKAAEQGSPVGQSGLGLMYLTGRGLPKDPSKALQFFTMAAEQGWVDGQLHLGNMYMTGIGVRRDYQQAAKYYNLAAQSGHILAIYHLAQMHATGTGMMRSCTAAVEFYKTVAERGRWGLLLAEAHNDYKEKRYSNALIKYLLLAELGYEAAQANAGFMLERGEVGWEIFEGWKKLNKSNDTATLEEKTASEESEDKTEEPPTQTPTTAGEDKNATKRPDLDYTSPQALLSRALQQWSRSATQGYAQARVRLGDYYYYGWGTQTDYSSAAHQYRLATEQQRNPQAMFNLAYMHEQGLGLKQDLHLAKRFYDMAAETSVDAKVPVFLALIKLSFLSTLQSFKLLDGTVDFDFFQVDTSHWDVYLKACILGMVGVIAVLQRRRRPGEGDPQRMR